MLFVESKKSFQWQKNDKEHQKIENGIVEVIHYFCSVSLVLSSAFGAETLKSVCQGGKEFYHEATKLGLRSGSFL